MVAAWTLGVAAALARGYNALTFYGPGQGLALLQQNLYFRPDWEQVIAPVVDWASTRPEVDPERIALLGISQAGYWVPRAVAFENRIAAAVADPGVIEVSASWTANLPPPMLELLDSGTKEPFDQYMAEGMREDPDVAAMLAFGMRPYGLSSPYEVYKATRRYSLAASPSGSAARRLSPTRRARRSGRGSRGSSTTPGPVPQDPPAIHGGRERRSALRAEGARSARPADFRLAGRDLELCAH
jgi:hypothetical protein